MKKIFTILTVVALAATTSFAQFSVKAGLNMANIVSNDDNAENGMKLGVIIGGSYALEISDAMNLDISASYKQSGTKETLYSVSALNVNSESSLIFSVNYLDISPSLSFNVSDVMSLSFGPYLAFALSGKLKSESTATVNGVPVATITSSEQSLKFGTDNNDDLKGTDFGLNIGAKFSINDAMSVSAGYALGLTNLMHNSNSNTTNIDVAKNSGIYLTFGYSFGGGYY